MLEDYHNAKIAGEVMAQIQSGEENLLSWEEVKIIYRDILMQTIQISDQIANQLTEMATKKHISTDTLIEQLIENEKNKPTLLTDVIKDLPTINAFKGDPVEIQRKMRNEWG